MTVTDDHGGVAAGLKRDWFSVFEKKLPLQITGFESSDEPVSVAVLVDLSNSVKAATKKDSIQAVSRFIKTANPNNEYLIIGFNKEPTVIAGWGRDQPYIEKELGDAAQRGAKDGTALYDACELALTKLRLSKYDARAMLMVSDGQDNASQITFTTMRERLRESSVTLYAIGLFSEFNALSVLTLEGQGVLDELSAVSGGRGYYPKSDKEISIVSEHIALELRHPYRIRFRPASAMPDNKWHPIKIKLALPERDDKGHKFGHLNIQSREGYYDR